MSYKTESGPMDRRVSVPEAAALLEVGETAVRRMLRDGSLPCVKVGRKHIIFRADVEALREGKRNEPQLASLEKALISMRKREIRFQIRALQDELQELENIERPTIGRGVKLIDLSN